MIASVVFLLAPFAAYLPAEELHVSGVLAAVSRGHPAQPPLGELHRSGDARARHVGMAPVDVRAQRVRISVDRPRVAVDPRGARAARPRLRALRVAGQRDRDRRAHRLGLSGDVSAALAEPRGCASAIRCRRGSPSPCWDGPACAASCRSRSRWRCRTRSATGRFAARSVMIFFTVVRDLRHARVPRAHARPADRVARRHRDEPQSPARDRVAHPRARGRNRAAAATIGRSTGVPLEREIADRVLEEYRQRIDVLRGKSDQDGQIEERESRIDRKRPERSACGRTSGDRRDAPRRRNSRRHLSLDRVRPGSCDAAAELAIWGRARAGAPARRSAQAGARRRAGRRGRDRWDGAMRAASASRAARASAGLAARRAEPGGCSRSTPSRPY